MQRIELIVETRSRKLINSIIETRDLKYTRQCHLHVMNGRASFERKSEITTTELDAKKLTIAHVNRTGKDCKLLSGTVSFNL